VASGEEVVAIALPKIDGEDPRLAFVYQEALRGLLQQQGFLESLHGGEP
jgi:hypothetical protein